MTAPTALSSYTEPDEVLEEPTPERALPQHRIRVTMNTGEEFVVRVLNRDRILWEKTAARKKWGNAADMPFFATTFLAFAAATRERLTDLSFEAFCDAADDVRDVPADEQEDVALPTRRAHEHG